MFNKSTRKGRNVTELDNWLDSLGYYRKNVAYDETCLFRAISEQLFDCQVYHERVRQECVSFARENYMLFSHIEKSLSTFCNHLDELEKHMAIYGTIDFHIISMKYKCDVFIFDGKKHTIENVTKYGYRKSVLLSLIEGDHFDAIYRKEYIVTAGFCQSIVYTLFYERVFQLENVDQIVRTMLYDKHNLVTLADCVKSEYNECIEKDNNNNTDNDFSQSTMIAPFPFKVAKALDPNIYRNIEYDTWGDTRRELRLGEWYYGDEKLIQGTRCIYTDPKCTQKHDCYIQEIMRDQNSCVIYLTKLAVKKTVSYFDLSPEDDAKPWELPWRFTKNLTISNTSLLGPVDSNIHKGRRRGKEKKRSKSEGSLALTLPSRSDRVDNVNVYIGAPLQMQNSPESSCRSPVNIAPTCQRDAFVPPDDPFQNLDKWVCPQPQWQTYLPPTPDSYMWSSNTPQLPPLNFNAKPMVASAPATPDFIPYHATPIYYSYNPTDTQPLYTQWSSNVDSPLQCCKSGENVPEQGNNFEVVNKVEQDEIAPNTTGIMGEESMLSHCVNTEKPQFTLTMPPQNSSVEVYSPIVPLHPGTPVIYTPTLPEVPEGMVPTSPILYTQQIDIQYISPAPCSYIYPPTPPATWCSPAVNSQGFIFPTPN